MKTAELRNLIKALGGPKVVGRECGGISSQAVSHWKVVPSNHVLRIEELARARRVRRSDGTPYSVAVLRPDMVQGLDAIRASATGADVTLVEAE
jgi:hypothetical protein